ncbi:MAG: alpha-galactosidase [Bacteroidales bacterium]|nr:alpha-galactosidase [Bacteroidales bacterium]
MKQTFFMTVLFSMVMVQAVICQQKQIIRIETENQHMLFTAAQGQSLGFLYWGDRLTNDAELQTIIDKNRQLSPAYPAYGGGCTLIPALRLTHPDGTLTTELIFESSQIVNKDDHITETVIHLKDKYYPISVKIRLIAYIKENMISQSVFVTNNGKKDLKIDEAASTYLPIKANSYFLTHFYGSWAREMQLSEELLTPGIKMIESKKGVRTTQSESPVFLISPDRPAQENSGEVYAGALAWSGNFALSFQIDETGLLSVLGGTNPFAATYNLLPGQTYQTPEMILSYSLKGKGQISRNFHDWTRRYNLTHGDQPRSILLNSWEGAYFNFDEKKITEMIDNTAALGIEMFVLDDGWFGNKYPRSNDKAGLGDWQVNEKKLPHGLKYLADYAVSKGLKFGIWMEPEMVNPESELAKKHPDWIVKSQNRDIPQMRNQWLLDMSNPQVQDFVFNTFDQIVSLSHNISYVKWDANRHVNSVGSDYLPEDKQTHFWYGYVKGLYHVYSRIREKYPDIEIQACASGGGRIDMGSLKYHDEFWTSDNTNAFDRIFIQYGTSTFFPSIGMASHVSTSPNHQTGMMLPLKFRFDVAMSGRLGLELQPKDVAENEMIFVKEAINTYKSIRPVIQFGDLFRLNSPYDESGWAALMYVSKDKKRSVFFAYSLKYHPFDRLTTRLAGLDPLKKYRISETNVNGKRKMFTGDGDVFSGDFLQKYGLQLEMSKPFDSVVLLMEEIEK